VLTYFFAARDLTAATTEYGPVPNTTPTKYSQNTYTANWLGQIAKANNEVLSKLELSKEHKLPIPIQSNISLSRLAELGARDPEVAWPIFQAFWSEITAAGRPPILFTLDGLNHIMKDSAYRNADFELIHAHDLTTVNLFVDYLSGAKKLANGGAILAATSMSNTQVSLAMNLALSQIAAKAAGSELPKPDPFTKYDERSLKSLQFARLMNLKGLSKFEAKGLMEYWAASGVFRDRVDQTTVTEKWAIAGNGIVGEIQRGVLNMRI
jgi:small subunit ribosomal protein S29